MIQVKFIHVGQTDERKMFPLTEQFTVQSTVQKVVSLAMATAATDTDRAGRIDWTSHTVGQF